MEAAGATLARFMPNPCPQKHQATKINSALHHDAMTLNRMYTHTKIMNGMWSRRPAYK
jgi:hypothetical protein